MKHLKKYNESFSHLTNEEKGDLIIKDRLDDICEILETLMIEKVEDLNNDFDVATEEIIQEKVVKYLKSKIIQNSKLSKWFNKQKKL